MDKHDVSRTPWTYEVHELSTGLSAVVYDENGQAIDTHLTEEKAALITRAANSHDDLVSALENLRNEVSGSPRLRPLLDAITKADAALSKAKGEQP